MWIQFLGWEDPWGSKWYSSITAGKSLLQYHSSKAAILWHSPFFIVQLSHLYMTNGKTIALTRRTFVGKVMSLLFLMLSRLVITFLPRRKYLLISWLQSPSAVILEPRKINSATVSTVSPPICQEVMGPDAMIFVFSFFISFSFRSHRALTRVLCAIQQVLISYPFYTYYCIYVIPNLPVHLTSLPCLGIHKFVPYICVFISALQISSP